MSGAASAAVIGIESDCGGTGTGLTGSSFSCSSDADRNDTGNIEIFEDGTGAGDDDFFSIGLGGTLVVEFDPTFQGPAIVIEITNAGAAQHQEAVEIFGSNDGITFTSLGIADNQAGISDGTRGVSTSLSFAGTFAFLGFRDISQSFFAGTSSTDGFDIDAISVNSVTPVPLPASALLLLAGVGGLGALRDRRKS